MRRLSSPISSLGGHWPVVVVGSGYGGAIAASRLARAGQKVCVLERGKERVPGEFPRNSLDFVGETQVHGLPEGVPGARGAGSSAALVNVHLLGDVAVINGSGLGGTSLINANVMLRPDARVLHDARWPEVFRQDVDGLLADGFRHAEQMLGARPYPEGAPRLERLEALRSAARQVGGRFLRPPLAITFEEGVNPAGVRQRACTLCGDCSTGCNVGAKNTTLMNYLPDAHRHGAQVFTQVAVHHVERGAGHWRVYYQLTGMGREVFDAPPQFLTADRVILAAGTLGSTEILLRSRAAGLSTSPLAGKRFSGNGDVMAFGYNLDVPVNAVGHGENSPEELGPIGPAISGIIDTRQTASVDEGMVIEEGAVPGALGSYLPTVFAAVGSLMGEDTDSGLMDGLREGARVAQSLVRGPYRGAIRNTMTYLVMSHDDGQGEVRLEGGKLRVVWPDVGRQPGFFRADDKLRAVTAALGGTYVRSPVWTRLLNHSLIITHPLGGCIMGEDAQRGVVDHEGRVFSGEAGTQVHEGLYVCDGAVVPRSVGVNPLLTISAVAERFCARMAARQGWSIDYGPLAEVVHLETPWPAGIHFTETLHGSMSAAVARDYPEAGAPDAPGASHLRFIVSVLVDDVGALLRDPEHPMRLTGCVLAPALSARPLTVVDGVLNVLVPDASQPTDRQLRYHMHLLSEEGERFVLKGFKQLHDDSGVDVWSDTTTLFTTVWRGEAAEGRPVLKGMLHLTLEDFIRQLSTLRVTNTSEVEEQLEVAGRFGRFFLGGLFEQYWKPVTLLQGAAA